jgi:hypothetical protein
MFTAIIVEPRIHSALKIVLNNFNKNLDENWKLLIYCGINNKSFIENIINNDIFVNRQINIVQLNINNLTIDEYNKLFFSDYFYSNITTEVFLVFQIDTLLSDIYNKNINNFLNYDYVGAPWCGLNQVGNGGLSLRKKSKMIELLNIGGFVKEDGTYHYEDRFFSNTCGNINEHKIILNKPSIDEAKQFSVETIFYDKSFGLHKPWNHLSVLEIDFLKKHFYDLEDLIKIS